MQLFLSREEETIDFGKRLGKLLSPGTVVTLSGDLGAGKTTLVKGIAKSLGVGEPVTSPTFSLLNIYDGQFQLAHIDAYRLNDSREGYEAGLGEYLPGGGITMVEWPENIADLLPEQLLEVRINHTHSGTGREVEIIAHGAAYTKLLKELEENRL